MHQRATAHVHLSLGLSTIPLPTRAKLHHCRAPDPMKWTHRAHTRRSRNSRHIRYVGTLPNFIFFPFQRLLTRMKLVGQR